MKLIESVTLRGLIAVALLGIHGSVFGAGLVYDTEAELITTADLDGDGREDTVLVDKASGTFRAGYQLATGNFSWSESRSLGATNITGLSAGRLTSTNRDSIAVTTPLLNRVNVIDAPSSTAAIVPLAAHISAYGPVTALAIEINDGTVYEDLMVSSTLAGGSTGYKVGVVSSEGTNFVSGSFANIAGEWLRANNIEYATGLNGAAILDLGASYLRVYGIPSRWFSHKAAKSISGFANPDYTVFHTLGSGYAHFALCDSGNSSMLYHFSVTGSYSFSATTSYDLGATIAEVFTVNGGGLDRLAVIFSDGSATIYSFDGSSAPQVLQSLSAPAAGAAYSGFVQTDSGSFLALTTDGSGFSEEAELYAFGTSNFVGSGATSLPAVNPGRVRGNVMVFENEPFIDPLPHRLQLLNAGDWTDEVNLLGGSPKTIQAVYETDQGLPNGLGNESTVSLGSAHSLAAYTLANQAHANFSIFNVNAAVGDQVAEAFISPEPGHYRSAVSVSFTNSTGAAIYYRTDSDTAWTLYSSPFIIFMDSTILYFSTDSGESSVIQAATYSFESDPSTLDSDGDGVPDYVELAYGLDPINSGSDSDGDGLLDLEEIIIGTDPNDADSDGDGVSDLNELREGTDPHDPADTPTPPFTGDYPRIEVASVFDLVLTPRPYDGVNDQATLSQEGTQVRSFSAGGWQYAYGTTTNLGLSGVTDPAVREEAIPSSLSPAIVCVLTEPHFNISTTHTNKEIGLEMVGVYPVPELSGPVVEYTYGGESLATEASNWVEVASITYTGAVRTVVSDELNTNDVLGAMMIERKLVDLLYDRGLFTNRVATLFSGRSLDASKPSVNQDDLVDLQAHSDDFDSYRVASIVETLNGAADTNATLADLRLLTTEFYNVCSDYGIEHPGACAQPIDALRAFLLDGSVNSNYQSRISLSGGQLTAAFNAAELLLDAVSSRPIETFDLEVRADSFSGVCPVLYTLGVGDAKSLYTAEGNGYVVPTSFELPIGAKLTAKAFTDVAWSDCPGTDPIEVISLSVTAIPTASGADSDGNLLPDDFEQNILGTTGQAAHHDSDGDGYSDLQEYLEQSDPSDSYDYPSVAIVDLSPPDVVISSLSPSTVQLDIDWPATYASPFVFTIVYTEDLTTGFSGSTEMELGALSEVLDTTAISQEFFRVNIQLR